LKAARHPPIKETASDEVRRCCSRHELGKAPPLGQVPHEPLTVIAKIVEGRFEKSQGRHSRAYPKDAGGNVEEP
jgi:hypothetical protein